MSRLPLEQMMASFLPLPSSSKTGTGACMVAVITNSPFSYAAARLGHTCDVGHLLGRFLGEQGEEGLGGDPGLVGPPPEGGCLALGLEVVPHEAERLPMGVGQLDADVGGELSCQVLCPFFVIGEEALVVDVD